LVTFSQPQGRLQHHVTYSRTNKEFIRKRQTDKVLKKTGWRYWNDDWGRRGCPCPTALTAA
jgi:hypothetical protein